MSELEKKLTGFFGELVEGSLVTTKGHIKAGREEGLEIKFNSKKKRELIETTEVRVPEGCMNHERPLNYNDEDSIIDGNFYSEEEKYKGTTKKKNTKKGKN